MCDTENCVTRRLNFDHKWAGADANKVSPLATTLACARARRTKLHGGNRALQRTGSPARKRTSFRPKKYPAKAQSSYQFTRSLHSPPPEWKSESCPMELSRIRAIMTGCLHLSFVRRPHRTTERRRRRGNDARRQGELGVSGNLVRHVRVFVLPRENFLPSFPFGRLAVTQSL